MDRMWSCVGADTVMAPYLYQFLQAFVGASPMAQAALLHGVHDTYVYRVRVDTLDGDVLWRARGARVLGIPRLDPGTLASAGWTDWEAG